MLDVLEIGDPDPTRRGGAAVVLLHGWGDSAEGIASLAPLITPAGARVFVPDGPLPHGFGGRGWWDLDNADRPAWAWKAELPDRYQPNAEVVLARQAVLDLLGQVRSRHEPDYVAMVGFSQGAMLALDVGLAHGSGVDRVAALSGVLLADSLPALLEPAATRPRFLVVHGEDDDEVPLAGGATARDLLQGQGLSVQWMSFPGGHDIPDEAALAVRKFLTADLG